MREALLQWGVAHGMLSDSWNSNWDMKVNMYALLLLEAWSAVL